MTKILLVEDDKSLREIYGVRLLAEGYDIVSAGDGEEALAMAIKERPQLIVSDVMMPKISGFDMLDILRSTTETKDIKVIMMTALSSEDQRARGEALGADRYLVKSQVGIEDVVRTVHDVLGDAPVSTSSAGAFAASPSATTLPLQPRTAPAAPQQQPGRPQPAPAYPTANPQPAQPAANTPQPSFTPPAPQPAGGLPQPTAPFSTNRPANLGDRIIHPIAQPAQTVPDLGSLMEQELNQSTAQSTPPAAAPIVPPRPPAPTPVSPPAVQPSLQPTPAPTQPVTNMASAPPQPTPMPAPTVPAQPVFSMPLPTTELHGASDISFEETPRATSPSPAQPFGSNQQPPAF